MVNSYLGPSVSRYVDRLSSEARGMGVWLRCNSCSRTAESSLPRKPAVSVPDRRVRLCRRCHRLELFRLAVGRRNIIAFDMGGTTAKAGLIENGEVRIAPGHEVGTGMNMSRLLTGGGYFIGAATVDLAEVGGVAARSSGWTPTTCLGRPRERRRRARPDLLSARAATGSPSPTPTCC